MVGEHADAARKLLFERLAAGTRKSIDFEPFAVVRDMLRDPDLRNQMYRDTIGGAPQIVKVYQYMSASPVGVFWPRRADDAQRPYLQGRPCLDYENIDQWVLDPDSLITERRSLVSSEPDMETELQAAEGEDAEEEDPLEED